MKCAYSSKKANATEAVMRRIITPEQFNAPYLLSYIANVIPAEGVGPRPDYWSVEYRVFDENNGYQEIASVLHGDKYWRVFAAGLAGTWQRIATATPPQWIKPQLQSGYLHAQGVEFGAVNGKILIRGSFFKGTAEMKPMETIFTLPEGYRPTDTTRSVMVLGTGSTWCGLADIDPNGIVRWNGHGVSPVSEGVYIAFPSGTEFYP